MPKSRGIPAAMLAEVSVPALLYFWHSGHCSRSARELECEECEEASARAAREGKHCRVLSPVAEHIAQMPRAPCLGYVSSGGVVTCWYLISGASLTLAGMARATGGGMHGTGSPRVARMPYLRGGSQA